LNLLEEKIKTSDSLVAWRESVRKKQQKLVMTNGCFDILHRGHIEYLLKAREQGDVLLVALNSDESVRTLKGPDRPLNDELSRALVLSALFFVDAVSVFNSQRCTSLIEQIKPDIYVKGADYSLETINQEEKTALLKAGTDIRFIEFVPGFSTSSIIERMKSN